MGDVTDASFEVRAKVPAVVAILTGGSVANTVEQDRLHHVVLATVAIQSLVHDNSRHSLSLRT